MTEKSWYQLSEFEQEEICSNKRINAQLAKDLNDLPEDQLTEAMRKFINRNLPLPRSKRFKFKKSHDLFSGSSRYKSVRAEVLVKEKHIDDMNKIELKFIENHYQRYPDISIKFKEAPEDLILDFKIGQKEEKSWMKKYTQKRTEKFNKMIDKFINLEKNNKSSKIGCIDVEQHEETGNITEVGLVLFDIVTCRIEAHHLIIDEFYDERNGKNVEDNKDNFNFGISVRISIDELAHTIKYFVDQCEYIIGHSFENDIEMLGKYMEDININQIIDTQNFSRYFFRENKRRSLTFLLDYFNIKYENLHNAGNDAYYTIQVLSEMIRHYKEEKLDDAEEHS